MNRDRIGFTFLLLEKAEKGKVPLVLPTQRSPRLQVPLSMGYQDEIQLDHDFMLCFFHLTEIQACFSGYYKFLVNSNSEVTKFYQVNVPLVLTN